MKLPGKSSVSHSSQDPSRLMIEKTTIGDVSGFSGSGSIPATTTRYYVLEAATRRRHDTTPIGDLARYPAIQ